MKTQEAAVTAVVRRNVLTPVISPARSDSYISGVPWCRIREPQIELADVATDRFDPKRVISQRGNHLVCLAHDRDNKSDVVLKVQRAQSTDPNGRLSGVVREFVISSVLPQHDNIIRIHELRQVVGLDGQMLSRLSMEFADGGSLRQWFGRAEMAYHEAKAIGIEYFMSLCVAVSALHEAGVLHLDLKPEHVLFCDGQVKLCDYGSAALMARPGLASDIIEKLRPTPTSSTVQYMAPECFEPSSTVELDERADIYALGVILFEIANPRHRPPFLGSYRRVAELHRHAPLPRVQWLAHHEEAIIARCTAKDPSSRFPSVDALLDALASMCQVDSPSWPGSKTGEQVACQPGVGLAEMISQELRSDTSNGDLKETLDLAIEALSRWPDHPDGGALCIALQSRVRFCTESLLACSQAITTKQFDLALKYARHAASVSPRSFPIVHLIARLEQRIDTA